MSRNTSRWFSVVVLVLGVLVVAVPARGQYVPPQAQPQGFLNQMSNLLPGRTQAYAAAPVQQPAGYVPPPAYPYYGGTYIPTPAEGYLNGVASVTNANAQYQQTIQQARITQSQADMARLDTRHRLTQEKLYEQSLLPDPEQVRQRDLRRSLVRSRRYPPATEIWSGVALNDLLMADQAAHRDGLMGPAVPVSPDTLEHINVTTGTTKGNVGVLNDGKPLQWPACLISDRAYQEDRQRLDRLVPELVQQVCNSPSLDTTKLADAQELVRRLGAQVRDHVESLTPDEYVGAKRFLNQLHDALKILQEPEAKNYFNRKWSAQGSTVAQLIDGLTAQGLRFAAANTGFEVYYTQLYQSMLGYDAALSRLARTMSTNSPPPPARR